MHNLNHRTKQYYWISNTIITKIYKHWRNSENSYFIKYRVHLLVQIVDIIYCFFPLMFQNKLIVLIIFLVQSGNTWDKKCPNDTVTWLFLQKPYRIDHFHIPYFWLGIIYCFNRLPTLWAGHFGTLSMESNQKK